MPAPKPLPLRGSGPPPRPNTPMDYIPTPVRTVAPTDTLQHLLNEQQGSPISVIVHPVPRERFTNFDQLPEAGSPTTTTISLKNSWRSKRSSLSAATKRISLSLSLGRDIVKKKIEAVKKTKTIVIEEKYKGQPSRTPSSSSSESLFKRRRLPKLHIPELRLAVEEALHSACSTDTRASPNFRVLELSPTSRELKYQWERDHHPADVAGEFHNMLSARRRVRKSKFGAEVQRYRAARPTWDDSWGCRGANDNREDRALLARLTEALQEQKDHATRLVQKNPGLYPGLETVSTPGCTLTLYWQHKSSYR
ncbi:hypothetical protein F4859DRAFT_71840 [Xylaria cf. heliscus]|nr:hypothetical protein F4859DRAFT_71840 [Xylaria cf. heliscus]